MLMIYAKETTNFDWNGIQLHDVTRAMIVQELNGAYTIEFSIKPDTAKKIELLVNESIVVANNQPFRILQVKKTLDEWVVYAQHLFFDTKDIFIREISVDAVSGQTLMNALFSQEQHNFTYSSDISKLSTMNQENKSLLEMMRIACERFEGEISMDRLHIALNERVGKDTELVIFPKKNIAAVVKEENHLDICTRVIVAYGSEEEEKEVIVTSELIGEYGVPKTKRYQNFTDGIQTEAEAIEWGLGKFKGINRIDTPKVSVEIDLTFAPEFSIVGIGDTLICKIPEINVDERVKVVAIEYDYLLQKKTKILIGYKPKSLANNIIGGAVEAIRPEIADVDDKLQQQINEANEAIQKEYEERIESVNDAIAKAEADAEVMKEELQTEISQAVTDWNTEFEEAKTNIDNSIGNVSKELGEYIESTDEIIERVDSELSELFDGLEANSGAITTITTEQGILSAKVGEVVVTADSALSKATEAQITVDGFSTRVGSLETSDSTQNSNISQLQQTASGLTSTVSSHTSSINGLNSTVSTHTSEIKQTSDKISMVVADGSSASAVQLTPNALTAIAKDINLKGNVQFDSLVEGDGTNTQILGGKIKTNSISANKLIVGNSQSLVRLTKGENSTGLDWVQNTGGTPFWVTKYVYSSYENRMVCILGDHISTRSLGLNGKSVQFSLNLTVFEGVKNRFAVQIFVYNDDGSGNPHCTTDWISPLWTQQTVKTQQYLTVPMTASHIMIRLIQEPYGDLTSQNPQHGVGSFSVTPMNAGELIVDGAIKANHIVSGSAELGAVTSKVLSTEALNAAWANIGNAFINKLTSDNALFQRLTAKQAWITSANIVSLEASSIKGKVLSSTNGRFKIDLDNAWLKAYATTGNPYITINQDAITLHNPNSTTGAAWGQLFTQNSRMTLRSRGDSSGLSLGYDSGGGYVEGIYLESSGVAYHRNQTNFAARVYAQSDLFQHRNGSHGGTMMISSSTEHSVKPTGANQGAVGTSGNYWNNSWVANRNNPSSLEFKNISHYLDDSESLKLVKNVGVARYFYKGDEFISKNSQTGLIYEDVRDQPQRDLLTNEEDKAINIYNMNSVLWSATREIDKTQTEQFEYLNEEIAILWKAVQELSEQNATLRDEIATLRAEIAIERSERETWFGDIPSNK